MEKVSWLFLFDIKIISNIFREFSPPPTAGSPVCGSRGRAAGARLRLENVWERALLSGNYERDSSARGLQGAEINHKPEGFYISGDRMMRFLLLFSRQGKLRLQKWFTPVSDREKKKVIRDMVLLVLARQPRSCNFLHWRDLKIVYKRYASLYFCSGLENNDNELLALEVLHRYVELLDKYFGNVCELDLIFNFEKAYYILDEFLMGGEVLETSKVAVSASMEEADTLQETMEEYMSKPTY
ncbi:AP-1 complex subunit sigma-3 [Dissostichus eleginoides]|nr:AP-1 complex subunit sigma-3 [Dissostichus eleginoides]